MIALRDPAEAAIDDARALIDALLEHGWHELHVANGETEIFIARDGGRANPMRAGSSVQADEPAAAAAQLESVAAPHVATVAWLAQVGAPIAFGDLIARIEVLGDSEDVLAPSAGQVAEVIAEVGGLVEYGDILLRIAVSR